MRKRLAIAVIVVACALTIVVLVASLHAPTNVSPFTKACPDGPCVFNPRFSGTTYEMSSSQFHMIYGANGTVLFTLYSS